jgi:hypothetical protein
MFQAESVRDAAFGCDWVGTPIPFQRCLMFIIATANKQFQLTAGKFVPVSNVTMMNVSIYACMYVRVCNEVITSKTVRLTLYDFKFERTETTTSVAIANKTWPQRSSVSYLLSTFISCHMLHSKNTRSLPQIDVDTSTQIKVTFSLWTILTHVCLWRLIYSIIVSIQEWETVFTFTPRPFHPRGPVGNSHYTGSWMWRRATKHNLGNRKLLLNVDNLNTIPRLHILNSSAITPEPSQIKLLRIYK